MAKTVSPEEIGLSVQRARTAARVDRNTLALRAAISLTRVLAIETGHASTVEELLRVAQALRVSFDSLVSESPASVKSWRDEGTSTDRVALELAVDQVVRDVQLLRELGCLDLPKIQVASPPPEVAAAERAAVQVRQALGAPQGPLHDLAALAQSLSLLTFSLALGPGAPDAAYVSLEGGGGVTVLNGDLQAGRRRFTLAHEIGHHVFQDAFATDWCIADGLGEGEKRINAFAVHLLLPRGSVSMDWQQERGSVRQRAVRLAARYRVSWTPLCNQLRTLGLIDPLQRDLLVTDAPSSADHVELEAPVVEELSAPFLAPRFSAAVIEALKSGRISKSRALELLRGTMAPAELPDPSLDDDA